MGSTSKGFLVSLLWENISFKQYETAASGSDTIDNVSPSLEVNPAAFAASRVAHCASWLQIAGVVNTNWMGVLLIVMVNFC